MLYISVSWISEVLLLWIATLNCQQKYLYNSHAIDNPLNPFAPGDFAEIHLLELVEWFSGHCGAIKS